MAIETICHRIPFLRLAVANCMIYVSWNSKGLLVAAAQAAAHQAVEDATTEMEEAVSSDVTEQQAATGAATSNEQEMVSSSPDTNQEQEGQQAESKDTGMSSMGAVNLDDRALRLMADIRKNGW